MVEIEVTPEQISYAKKAAKDMGPLTNSITNGQGNIAGFLGEKIVADYFGYEINNTYDYDLLNGEEKIDVKTKRTGFKPQSYYDCSIAAYNLQQQCDSYIFVRVLNDFSKAWILGKKSKVDYFKEARLLKKGSTDGSNNFTVKADCYNLKIQDLEAVS